MILGIAVLAVAKAIIVKFMLFDQPAYEKCISSLSNLPTPALACGTDPVIYFIIGWVIVAAGGLTLIFGLKADDIRTRISR